MENYKENYNLDLEENIDQKVKVIANNSHQYATNENLKFLFKILDLTSLNTTDNNSEISVLCAKVNSAANEYSDLPSVAAVCVYPPFIEIVKDTLADKNIRIASVGANFPSAQTFLNVKKTECKEIVNCGADEVDIVLSVGRFLNGEYNDVKEEIKEIKEAVGNKKLKVILETGLLNDYNNILLASIISMEAGADFIKTSTGKLKPAATLDAVYVMCKAIKSFYSKTGKMVGIKPAGGISTVEDALSFYAVVKEVLGEHWLNSSLFRIGASRLANDIISKIYEKEVEHF
ncbi:MAG: deoxyribose-phosphate aldolase [Bacteroidota bacterium]